ncbi:hypothetical protein GCM10009765_78320 [Fodinicola feengrottensis]|uniref:ABC transporter permease n=1 Tax=Fodinicola feengrottensis TaxID=435914 RepID=A0ABN2J558_9ACTN
MNDLVRAEFLKIRSVRSSWILAAGAVIFCVLWTILDVFVLKPSPGETAHDRIAGIYQMAQQSYLFLLIFGILGTTGEYRHQTVTWAFLASPVRERVLAAKAVAYALTGLLISAVAAAATAVTAAVSLASAGKQVFEADVPAILVGCVVGSTLYTLLGLAIGALVRQQIVAVSLAFGWFYYAEFLLVFFLPAVGKWLPSGAEKALLGWHLPGVDLLPIWAGAALFLAYVAALTLVATRTTLRRDIT